MKSPGFLLPMRDPPPAPRCALCGHAVERMTWWCDVAANEIVYVADCHGDQQRVALRYSDFLDAGPSGITVGRAFDGPLRIRRGSGPWIGAERRRPLAAPEEQADLF